MKDDGQAAGTILVTKSSRLAENEHILFSVLAPLQNVDVSPE
jgi:hypothetical protein